MSYVEASTSRALGRVFSVAGLATLVTGGASGLGLAMGAIMAECGANVTLADCDAPGLAGAKHKLAQRGLKVDTEVVDVADREAMKSTVDHVYQKYGRLDVVFANAGISAGPGPLQESGLLERVEPAAWDRVIGVNLTGVFTTIQETTPLLRDCGGGRIVVTASVAGLRGERNVGYAYAASKAAVVNLVRQCSLELARYDIRINGIAPGSFLTNLGGGRLSDPDLAQDFLRDIPLGRLADPSEIHGLALLLASPASSYMTGVTVPIDGGIAAISPGR